MGTVVVINRLQPADGSPTQSPARRDSRNVADSRQTVVTMTMANGARGTRTPDLLGAIQALSQLSYSPERRLPGVGTLAQV